MSIRDAETMIVTYMVAHGLFGKDWGYKFTNAKARFGSCNHNQRLLKFSKPLVELNDESQVKDTILHEIAHALCPPTENHGRLWKQTAKEIGCSAETCYDPTVVKTPEKKFIGVCPSCGVEVKRHKRRRIACGACCNKYSNGRWDEDYLFQWSINQNY